MMMINVGVRVERDDGLYGTGIFCELKRPRCDTNEESETVVTVTS